MTSAPIPVVPSALDRFVISTITSPVTAGAPVAVTIRAADTNGNTVPGFDGSAVLNANTGSGSISRDGEHLLVTGDAACPDAVGRYAVELGDVDRAGLLPQHRAQTMTLTAVEDPCPSRASALGDTMWTLRASGRDGVYGICDPPNEEAAITGHWPEPSGCSQE